MLNITNQQGNEIKTTMSYHLIPTEKPIIKETNNKCWRECREKWTLVHCWEQYKFVQPLWKTVWRVLKKLKIELSYALAILTLGYLSKENENTT